MSVYTRALSEAVPRFLDALVHWNEGQRCKRQGDVLAMCTSRVQELIGMVAPWSQLPPIVFFVKVVLWMGVTRVS
jgi:hypothetical protein